MRVKARETELKTLIRTKFFLGLLTLLSVYTTRVSILLTSCIFMVDLQLHDKVEVNLIQHKSIETTNIIV